MEKHLAFLSQLLLFRGISQPDILQLLRCTHARVRRYDANQTIWEAAAQPPILCIVLSGSLFVMQEDWRGNRSIIARIEQGEFLGEGAMCTEDWHVADDMPMPFTLAVRDPTTVLLMDSGPAISPCQAGCACHRMMMNNMLASLMEKQLRLLFKIEHLSKRSIREKLMSYLSVMSARAGSNRFVIPYNRQELADYLSVDRSALSAELSRMRQEGLLLYHKDSFELLDPRSPF